MEVSGISHAGLLRRDLAHRHSRQSALCLRPAYACSGRGKSGLATLLVACCAGSKSTWTLSPTGSQRSRRPRQASAQPVSEPSFSKPWASWHGRRRQFAEAAVPQPRRHPGRPQTMLTVRIATRRTPRFDALGDGGGAHAIRLGFDDGCDTRRVAARPPGARRTLSATASRSTSITDTARHSSCSEPLLPRRCKHMPTQAKCRLATCRWAKVATQLGQRVNAETS